MRAYRTLVVERQLTKEEFARLGPLLRRLSALASLWARGYPVYPPDLRYFAKEAAALAPRLQGEVHGWLTGQPAFTSAQVLRPGERDNSRGVVVKLPEGLLRVRRGVDVEVRLDRPQVSWIERRLAEGASLAMALVRLDEARRRLYVHLVFRRDVQPITPEPGRFVAVDVNGPIHGLTYGVTRDGRLVEVRRLTPPSLLPKTRTMAIGKWAAEVVQKAMEERAVVLLDAPREESARELYAKGGHKLHLLGMLKAARRIEELAAWHGVPVRRVRLLSSRCPSCGARLEEARVERDRIALCRRCGLVELRDVVPLRWAARLAAEGRLEREGKRKKEEGKEDGLFPPPSYCRQPPKTKKPGGLPRPARSRFTPAAPLRRPATATTCPGRRPWPVGHRASAASFNTALMATTPSCVT